MNTYMYIISKKYRKMAAKNVFSLLPPYIIISKSEYEFNGLFKGPYPGIR